MDIRTLIFSLGLLNITLALVVFTYRYAAGNTDPVLRHWQLAKAVAGAGFMLSWLRPWVPEPFMVWMHAGNVMSLAGMALELVVYARFLGADRWVRPVQWSTALAMVPFLALIAIPASRHPMVVYGTAMATLIYVTLAVLCVRRTAISPRLLRLSAATSALLALIMASKVLVGLSGYYLVPYAVNLHNILIYSTGFWVMCVNGLVFLMLVQQRADSSLQSALQQLTLAEQSERELLRTAAHEFRTPAAMVKASVDSLALLDKDLPAAVVQRHNNIRLAVQRMNDLANTLITRDRLHDRAMAPQKVDTDMCHLVRQALQHYPPDANLVVEASVPVIRAVVDPTLARIAVQNLIDNALHTAPQGLPILVALSASDTACIVQVKDQGPGVPDTLKPQLFHQRYSSSGSLSKGVGLTIVRQVAEAHGGHVSVADNSPSGSVFTLTLPI